jgi:beta-lactam-binding protein with PASTA domain
VTLVVSSGPEKVQVPDVVGKDRDDATERAQRRRAAAASPSARRRRGSRHRARAGPAGGHEGRQGSQVELVVAKAPPESRCPTWSDRRQGARDALPSGVASRSQTATGRVPIPRRTA